ncbi:unnamed protein product, partial [Ilex paraguariensis]
MSSSIEVASEQLCYIPCSFCNIVLAAPNYAAPDYRIDMGSSSKCNKKMAMRPPTMNTTEERTVNRPPEKRQRVPSAYNQFI